MNPPDSFVLTALGPSLASRRKAMGFSQFRTARGAGISQQHLSLIERGRLQPELATLKRLAKVLGLELTVALRQRTPMDERMDQWRAFKEWEAAQPALSAQEGFERAEALAAFFIGLHGLPAEENRAARLKSLSGWRQRVEALR